MKDLSEENLISLAINGSELAWREVYHRYFNRVRRVVAWRKWGFTRAEVDEIIQEVFLELIKALPNFRYEASLSTFLTKLSKNKCISVLRRKNAQKRVREEYGFVFDDRQIDRETERKLFVESKIGNPEEILIFGEEAMGLMKAMKNLNPDCREVIKKRYFDELSYKEICGQLDLPLGTVCSRLKRCLLRLKEIILKNSGEV
ncbi:MAG: RNA polymerase sigma factor [Candidatus Eremiobacteraeota bacterium]|nr:RNA polymerase sigma factor [Candidatus Eremiobacteraeota bacterium]